MTKPTRRPSRLPHVIALVAAVGLALFAVARYQHAEQLVFEWGRHSRTVQAREELRALERRRDPADQARIEQLRRQLAVAISWQPSEPLDAAGGHRVVAVVAGALALACFGLAVALWRGWSRRRAAFDKASPSPAHCCQRCRRFVSWWHRPLGGRLLCTACLRIDLAFPLAGEPTRRELALYLRVAELCDGRRADRDVVAGLVATGVGEAEAARVVGQVHAERERQRQAGYSDKNPWESRPLPCPCCRKPTRSLRRHQVVVFCLFFFVGAFFQKGLRTGCPSCIRGTIWKWTLLNAVPANLVWLCGLLPVAIWWTVASFFRGHSALVVEAHLPDPDPAVLGLNPQLVAKFVEKASRQVPGG